MQRQQSIGQVKRQRVSFVLVLSCLVLSGVGRVTVVSLSTHNTLTRTKNANQNQKQVLEMLASGERKIHTFLRVSLKHFQAERERVIGTADTAAALDMLLSEKLETLEKLPEVRFSTGFFVRLCFFRIVITRRMEEKKMTSSRLIKRLPCVVVSTTQPNKRAHCCLPTKPN